MKRPSLRTANMLFLLTSLLILTVGSFMQSKALSLGLIGTEALLIFLPTLLFIYLGKQPVKETLRLRWPGWRPAVLGLLIGAGIWPISLLLNSLAVSIFGYTPPSPEGWNPTTIVQAVLFFLALAVITPLCEESLWRGYIQRAYEPYGPLASVLLVSLFFAIWHLRLQGLLPIIPISLALGYLAWRSNSLVPGILAHFANNGLTALVAILTGLGLVSATALGMVILVAAVIGVPLALIGLFLFRLWTKSESDFEPKPAAQLLHPAFAWPVLGIVIIYCALAYVEVKTGQDPNNLNKPTAQDTLLLESAPWNEKITWEYDIHNLLDASVGRSSCSLTPGSQWVGLQCNETRQQYEVHQGSSSFYGGAGKLTMSFQWNSQTMGLESSKIIYLWDNSPDPRTASAVREDGALVLRSQDQKNLPQRLALPEKFLLDEEWRYRLSALAFDKMKNGKTTMVWPTHFAGGINSNTPVMREATVVVRDPETVSVPAGEFQAYPVELTFAGTNEIQKVWYSVQDPHILLKYNNGFAETYLLVR